MNRSRLVFIQSLLLTTAVVSLSCASQTPSEAFEVMNPDTPTFLVLGDSYTIGESVDRSHRWPVLLASGLREAGIPVGDPTIVARTGWTTSELRAGIQTAEITGRYEMVSLLIGVNNQYRGLDPQEYQTEFRDLLSQAINFAGGDPGRVLVLSIPDWGVTPFADGRDRARIAAEIDEFNEVNRAESDGAGAVYLDVTAISREAATDPSLVAEDGLHPSGVMYARWADLALPHALEILGSAPAVP